MTWIAYAVIGKLTIYLIQKFPLTILFVNKYSMSEKFLKKSLSDLLYCDLCLGVWLYFFLAFFFDINLFGEWFYIPIISELLTGAATSFVVHIFSLGWNSKFVEFHLE